MGTAQALLCSTEVCVLATKEFVAGLDDTEIKTETETTTLQRVEHVFVSEAAARSSCSEKTLLLPQVNAERWLVARRFDDLAELEALAERILRVSTATSCQVGSVIGAADFVRAAKVNGSLLSQSILSMHEAKKRLEQSFHAARSEILATGAMSDLTDTVEDVYGHVFGLLKYAALWLDLDGGKPSVTRHYESRCAHDGAVADARAERVGAHTEPAVDEGGLAD